MFGINSPNKIVSRQILAMTSIGIAALLIGDILPAASAQLANTTTGPNGANSVATMQQSQEGGRRLTLLGAIGVSLVKDVKVTGAVLNDQSNRVTVTISSTSSDNSTASTTTPAVTAVAIKTQLDLTGLLGHSMMMGMQSNQMTSGTSGAMAQGAMGSMMGTMGTSGGSMLNSNASGMQMIDIKSFINNLQIGSAVAQKDWSSPHPITIPIVEGSNSTSMMSSSSAMMASTTPSTNDTDIVIVLIVPYTGSTQTPSS